MKKKNKKDILVRFSEEELKMLDEIYNYVNNEENIRITKSFIIRYGIATLYKKIKNNELEERISKAIEYIEKERAKDEEDNFIDLYLDKYENDLLGILKGVDKE